MSSRLWVWLPFLALLVGACSGERESSPSSWTGVCVDADGDGFGFQCAAGEDCDDQNPDVFEECAPCTRPEQGCACEEGAAPIDCMVSPEVTGAGALICRDGVRYCRDGVWSGCEGISSFLAPPPSELKGRLSGLFQADAGFCSPCSKDCYEITDTLTSVTTDAGVSIAPSSGGGITLSGSATDAAVRDPNQVTPVPPCDTAVDSDCDGIPDALDPFPGEKPFASSNATIFMDLAPGTSKSTTFDLSFFLRTADIYFLVDMTGSMGEERNNLISSLQSGRFLDDPATPTNEDTATVCADRNFDTVPDNELKTQGIAGNIACLIRDSAFGAGWYREIPFSAPDKYGIQYADPNFEAFEHRLDVTPNVAALSTALPTFVTRGNRNWAEAGTVALSAVATGGPIYMGWDRPAIPPRLPCANGGFGYPCFRPSAMPIVILITDAPLMNGPIPSAGNLGSENTYSAYNDRQPVDYEALGLRYMSRSSDGAYYPVSGNEDFNTAYDVGVIDDSFKTYTGDTRSMAPDIHAQNLGGTCTAWPSNASSESSPGYPDAVFKFRVTSNKTLTVSTRGTRFKPTLAVLPATMASTATIVASNNATPGTAQNLGSLGTLFTTTITGDTDPATFNTGELPSTAISECLGGASATAAAPDAWFRFTVPQDLTNVKFSVDGSDFDAVLGLWSSPPVPTALVESVALGTNDKFFTSAAALSPGSASSPGAINGRSVWLSGGSTSASGFVHDYSPGLFSGVDSSCSGVSGNTKDAVVDFRITGSTPQTVRIGTTSASDILGAASFDHVVGLFARPASGGSFSTAIACNKNGGGTRRALIERTLNPGNYSVVVRGEVYPPSWCWWCGSADQGSYGLQISDAVARPIACHLESARASFTTNLKAGVTYYLGMRGRNTGNGGGRGPYSINITNNVSNPAVCAYDNTTYSNSGDISMSLGAAEITQTFAPGEYYAIVKGRADINDEVPSSDTARGWYQITIGDRNLATNNQTASMPVWGTATSGVRKQLTDKGIRVITVPSTKTAVCGRYYCSGGATNQNTALTEQATAISKATGATATDGSGLVFPIYNDGSGMGFAVVNAVNKLARNLSMNVSVRFVPLPDTPSPSFGFVGRAVSVPGNSCTGASDTNGDGVLDTHLGCRPGATPRFEVTFTNPPAPNNVPPNPADGSNGGYNMKLQLIADGQYVIDETPVFIIPQDVVPDPPTYLYAQTGYYTQDIVSNCAGTNRPEWRTLGFTATVPAGTSIDWRACLGDTNAELDQCVAAGRWTTLSKITAGVACMTDADCAGGYCSAGTCQYAKGAPNVCTAATDCDAAGNAECISTACAWTSIPMSLLAPLRSGLNGKARMRLQAILSADATRAFAPSVQDLKVVYVCSPGV